MRRAILLATLILTLVSGTATADSLQGRFGVTGKVGAVVPLQDDFISGTSDSNSAIAAGGGLIFGLSRNCALEIDVTHVPELDLEIAGDKAYEATFTDIALGFQYRIASDNRLVPFIGFGVDFIKGDLEHVNGTNYDLEWTVGGHVNAGMDYFITRGIALTVDLRGLYAAKGDVEGGGTKVGEYDPMSFIGTAGIRLILPEHAFW
ncbi:MAG: hypothetical protein A2075_00910 [Geobacteraceae bacterium GWC2_58_44]|nr:MAG: hypothetical protein A2075_00910 [Geobacteraceae bacterium GWC2_58_44]